MPVKETEGETGRERANTWSCRWTHTQKHTHSLIALLQRATIHSLSLLYQQNESAFWRYLNETEKSPIQPLCPAFINTARHWGDISLPSLTPSVCVPTHTHTHKQREVSCSGMMMPPPHFFSPLLFFFLCLFLVGSSSLRGFCYLTSLLLFSFSPPHLPLSSHFLSLSLSLLSVCLCRWMEIRTDA